MTCQGCKQSTACDCVVTAASNSLLEITGAGTQSDPYVVSNSIRYSYVIEDTTGKAIPTGVATAIPWEATLNDSHELWNEALPSRIPTGKTGWWKIQASVSWMDFVATGERRLRVLVDGAYALPYGMSRLLGSSTTVLVQQVTGKALITNANSYFQIEAFQNSGGTRLAGGIASAYRALPT